MEKETVDILQKVPEEIRDWFGSEKVTRLIMEINRMFGLKDERTSVIPWLLYLLEIKELPAYDFIDFLALKLKTTPQKALIIAKEIKEKILLPIQGRLISWGIDPDLIDLIDAENRTTIKDVSLEKPEKLFEEKSEKETEKSSLEETTALPESSTSSVIEPSLTQPFVLYEEKPLVEEARKPFIKPFSLPFKIFGQQKTEPPASVQVKVETTEPLNAAPETKLKISKKVEKPHRIVHYSEFRTPLSPFGQEEGIIDLETFETLKKPSSSFEPEKTEPSSSNQTIINLKEGV